MSFASCFNRNTEYHLLLSVVIATSRELQTYQKNLISRLTEKSQLSDLWNIDLDAASLATANHFEDLEENIKEPQPSLDYKPVDMSKKETKPIPIKRKRGKMLLACGMSKEFERSGSSITLNMSLPGRACLRGLARKALTLFFQLKYFCCEHEKQLNLQV